MKSVLSILFLVAVVNGAACDPQKCLTCDSDSGNCTSCSFKYDFAAGCQCDNGQYLNDNGGCTRCGANNYTENGACVECPQHSTSAAGTRGLDGCRCDEGYKKAGSTCVADDCGGCKHGVCENGSCNCTTGYLGPRCDKLTGLRILFRSWVGNGDVNFADPTALHDGLVAALDTTTEVIELAAKGPGNGTKSSFQFFDFLILGTEDGISGPAYFEELVWQLNFQYSPLKQDAVARKIQEVEVLNYDCEGEFITGTSKCDAGETVDVTIWIVVGVGATIVCFICIYCANKVGADSEEGAYAAGAAVGMGGDNIEFKDDSEEMIDNYAKRALHDNGNQQQAAGDQGGLNGGYNQNQAMGGAAQRRNEERAQQLRYEDAKRNPNRRNTEGGGGGGGGEGGDGGEGGEDGYGDARAPQPQAGEGDLAAARQRLEQADDDDDY